MSKIIEVKDLAKPLWSIKDRIMLKNVNFSVKKGK